MREHAPENVMDDPDEIEAFHDGCSELMRELLDGLAAEADAPRPFGAVEDAIGWPRRRIASVLRDERDAASGRWEIWMDAGQADVVRAARR
jgi:hypothetical protein